jgi:cytochrome oxidase Cu insertion factor (SCO1/SenC/PrrC family)
MWTFQLAGELFMNRIFLLCCTIALFAAVGLAQTPTATPVYSALKTGDKAPDFEINDTTGTKVKLSDFRGKKNVVLAFYVLAFTGG